MFVTPFLDFDLDYLAPWHNHDDRFFARALFLAQNAQGTTYPNPSVGAVVVDNGSIVAEGFTLPAGGFHAERHALNGIKNHSFDATLYVTLEPCCHVGRTPPCTDAIIKSGIKSVVYGVLDENPKVHGGGIKALQAAGIKTNVINNPLLLNQAHALARPFRTWVKKKRPYIVLKIATTKDNKITHKAKTRSKITNPASDLIIHRLRSRIDAILTSTPTARIDDPELSVRHVPSAHQPTRIVISRDLSLERNLKIFQVDTQKTIVVTHNQADKHQRDFLQQKGISLLDVTLKENHLALDEVFLKLANEGFTSILIEAGASLFAALVKAQVVDEIWWFTSHEHAGCGVDLGYSQQQLLEYGFKPCYHRAIDDNNLTILASSNIF